MSNNMRVLVLGVTRFDGEVEGKHYKTAKVIYLPEVKMENDYKRGLIPAFVPADFHIFEQITKIPAVYNISYELFQSARGVSVKFLDAEFVTEIIMTEAD